MKQQAPVVGRFSGLFAGLLLLAGLSSAQSTAPAPSEAAAKEAAATPKQAPKPADKPATKPALPHFEDVAAAAGITFEHGSAPEKKYIVESMSSGVGVLDFDNDGRLDIYLLNSLTVDTAQDVRSAKSALYRNVTEKGGKLRFEDVSDRAGVAYPGWGMGLCVADLDGDGFQDVYVTALGTNRLYRNRGDGTFEEIAAKAGVTAGGWSAGCGFADYDRDGDLDLFVARYVRFDLDNLPEFGKEKTCQYRGIAVQCGPRGLPGTPDLLYRNDGDWRFTEVSAKAGVADPDGYFGMGIAWFDANADGWPDLFVANDSTPNFLYLNKKDGTFEEAAFPMGVAVSEDGAEQGGMGVAVADYRNEGRFSLFVTNFAEEYNALFHNDVHYFTDVSFRSATAAVSLPYVGWGTAFFDYDNDGWQDLIVVNGHVYPQLDHAKLGASAPYRQRRLFYRNNRDGTFEEIGQALGEVFTSLRVSRGLAVGDFDDDGRLDLITNDLDGAPQLLHNRQPDPGAWLSVQLEGRGRMTDAIGAVITVTTGKLRQMRLVSSGTSYLSQNDMRQHFGLGEAKTVDSVHVLWPDGTTSEEKNVAVNQSHVMRQPKP